MQLRHSPFVYLLCPICLLAAQVVIAADLDGLYNVQSARSRRASSASLAWQNTNGDSRPIPPGQTLTVADLKGPGIIRHIWFTIGANDPEYSRTLTLRMYWDGQEEPAVESPIGDFFAVGHGQLREVQSAPVAVSSEGRARNCYWAMPFAKSARITLTNDSKKHPIRSAYWYVDYEEVDSLPPTAANFHAQYRQEYPAKMGEDYLILDAEGQGQYVGTVLSAVLRTPGWFGEGDDRFYIDGAEEPQLKGTGTEDYFCDAWGFRLFNRPYYGITLNGSNGGREIGDFITAYRWHIADPVHFSKSLKVTIEHKGNMFDENRKRTSGFTERPDLMSSVAFWYQTGQAKRFATLPPAEERTLPHHLIEFEAFTKGAKAEPASTTVETQNGGYSGGKQLWAKFTDPQAELVVPFELERAVQGKASLRLTKGRDYGNWTVLLDGKALGKLPAQAMDLYAPRVESEDFDAGYVDLAAGTHQLKFQCAGRDKDSTGYYLGVDALDVMELSAYLVKPAEKKN